MNKKRLAVAGLSVGLVAVAGIGATLAYFTDQDVATNVVEMGHVDIELDEPIFSRMYVNNTITNVVPNQSIKKDPTITVGEGSEDCYLRVQLTTEYLDNDFDIEVVIPGKTLNEVSKILEDIESIVNITFTNNHILFDLGETKIISRLLEGKYVNYLSLLPQEHKLLINVNRQELQNGIERASLMAKEGNSNLVKLEMNEESIIITSNSQLGKVREEVTANMQGDPIQIAFNSRYIIDVLKNMEDDNVQIEMTSSVSPCVIKGKEAESYKYLVLPVRLIR